MSDQPYLGYQQSIDLDNNNTFYHEVDSAIHVPSAEEISIKDPEVFMARLKELTTPYEQFKHFFLSAIGYDMEDPTHEGTFTRRMTGTGIVVGWILGAFSRAGLDMQKDYIRQHNASVFDNKYRARRHRTDTFMLNLFSKGMPVAFKTGLMCFCAGMISFSTITYRGQLYYPDWALGFGALGSMSRLWLGTRGVLAGGCFGVAAGTFAYGLVRLSEVAQNQSVIEMRYNEEMSFQKKRAKNRDRLTRLQAEWFKEKVQ